MLTDLVFSKIQPIFMGVLFFYSCHALSADGFLFTESVVQNSSGTMASNTLEPIISLQISSSQELIIGRSYRALVPNQGEMNATVIRKTEDPAHQTLTAILLLESDLGTIEVIETNNQITDITIYTHSDQGLYRANFANSQQAPLKTTDIDTYLCDDYPKPPRVAQLNVSATAINNTPDLATLHSLQSKPTSTKVLYINYWGGVLSGTAWNDNYNSGADIPYTPFSNDADTSNFSDNDRYLIWQAWLESSEDYAAFDINLTTDQSVYDATPIANRVQLLVTQTNIISTGIGGIAYLGIFNRSIDYYKTGWVFNNGVTTLAPSISHESGHQMGLSHDGTPSASYYSGHNDWGPIMGAPFGMNYLQWSQGEYPEANNQEDDLAIISSVLGNVDDEAGNTIVTATTVSLPLTKYAQISPQGLFNDTDVYHFNLLGNNAHRVHIELMSLLKANNEQGFANLAMNASLKDTQGNIIAQMSSADASPLAVTSNTFSYEGTLNAGDYYLTISASSPYADWTTGFRNYGNGGEYLLTMTSAIQNPEISITPSTTLRTSEWGGKAYFMIALKTQPSAEASINLQSSNVSEGTVSPSAVSFNSSNWHIPQKITVLGINDGIVDGNKNYQIITAPAVSNDADYQGINAADVGVTNWENQPIAAGIDHLCVLDSVTVSCWGHNDVGQISVPTLSNPHQVASGYKHSCAIDDTGVVCWGDNGTSQLNVPTLSNPIQIDAGYWHTCVIDDSGVVCWGNNGWGQTTVPTLNNPNQVKSGYSHSCALAASGVVCWGDNNQGQTTVPTLSNPSYIDVGYDFSCAIDDTGVVCWGDNTNNKSTPPALLNPIMLSTGDDHACAIDESGVACWGSANYAQITVPTLANPLQIASSSNNNCTVDDTGVVCWGADYYGQSTLPTTVNLNFNKPVNGVCGSSDNAQVAKQPTNNLCLLGFSSKVTGNNPWLWSCQGYGLGITENCSTILLGSDNEPAIAIQPVLQLLNNRKKGFPRMPAYLIPHAQ